MMRKVQIVVTTAMTTTVIVTTMLMTMKMKVTMATSPQTIFLLMVISIRKIDT